MFNKSHNLRVGCLILAATASAFTTAQAQDLPAEAAATVPGPLIVLPPPPDQQRFVLEQVAGTVSTGQAIGTGDAFDPIRLPAAFATLYCTGTLVGPRVLLTAAHCLNGNMLNGKGAFIRTDQGTTRILGCSVAPTFALHRQRYPAAMVAEDDFALCELEANPGVTAETLDLSPSRVMPGTELMIGGFGCNENVLQRGRLPDRLTPEGASAYSSNYNRRLRMGMNQVLSEVVVLSAGVPQVVSQPPAAPFVQGWRVMVGTIGQKEVTICPGDSGGAAYAGATLSPGPDRGWRVVAVNSAVGVSPAEHQRDPTGMRLPPPGIQYWSYLSPLADPDFAVFLRTWMAESPQTRKVCGIDDTSAPTFRCRE